MELSKHIACICEGTAEQVVIERLLDADKLIFTYENMLEGEVIRCRGAKNFEKQYLRKDFNDKITILRILDSRHEKFNLSKAYAPKINNVINVITAPEIEMLIIFNENKYDDYKQSKRKPSEFCKINLKYKNVKGKEFLNAYFNDVDTIIFAIKEYKRVSKIPKGEYVLADLLKWIDAFI